VHKKEKYGTTELTERDRKVLDKYTKSYSNFIESNTAKPDMLQEIFLRMQSLIKVVESTGKVFPDFARIFLFQFISPFIKIKNQTFLNFIENKSHKIVLTRVESRHKTYTHN